MRNDNIAAKKADINIAVGKADIKGEGEEKNIIFVEYKDCTAKQYKV